MSLYKHDLSDFSLKLFMKVSPVATGLITPNSSNFHDASFGSTQLALHRFYNQGGKEKIISGQKTLGARSSIA